MITEEDKDEFIGQMRGLAFTEDGRYETKAKELLNELIDEIKGETLPIDSVSNNEVAVFYYKEPDIYQDNTGLIYCSECKSPMAK